MKRPKLAALLLLIGAIGGIVLAILGVRGLKSELPEGPGEPLGLITSLPIYWADGAELGDFAQGNTAKPWTRVALERDYELAPFETLLPSSESEELLPGLEMPDGEVRDLSKLDRLAIIQPRGLNPEENVALDEWVREGGRLLLVLDPLLSGHYSMPIFDPRHPTSSVLVPPVVERWGLELSFDETQPMELRVLEARHGLLPVVMGGEVSIVNDEAADCTLDADNVIAHCQIEKGRVTLVADAALFEADDPGEEGEELVRRLVRDALE